MKTTRYQQVATIIRGQITDGILPPGAPAPSGAALARLTGYCPLTCRRALRILVADGTLVPGATGSARPRVPGADHSNSALADAKRALRAELAARRCAAGLTQPQLAELIGFSTTTVGHAETGRNWQSRLFWEHADKVLNANGELLRLHDAYRATEIPSEPTTETEDTPPETDLIEPPAMVTVDVPGPVAYITITWTNGTVTTVRPPANPRAGTTERDEPEL